MRLDLALTTTVIFSVTGLSVVQFSSNARVESVKLVHEQQSRSIVESNVNLALWRVNTLPDSMANTASEYVTTVLDTNTDQLTVVVNHHDRLRVVEVDLFEDMHFNHSLATNDTLEMGPYSIGEEADHGVRGEFRFLPQVDTDYFTSNAVQVHPHSDWIYYQSDFDEEGIHIFTGDNVWLYSVTLHNSTLVFESNYVYFYKDNDIRAPQPAEGQAPLPALVFTNENIIFRLAKEWWNQDTIHGAIYCAGKIILKHGTFTGPIVAHKIAVKKNLNFIDDDHDAFYAWPRGFGNYTDYDWPQHITNWAEYTQI